MPIKEKERLHAVHRFLELNFSKEKELYEIVEIAAKVCGTKIAFITLIHHETQYIKFQQDCNFDTTLHNDVFCNYVIQQEGVVVVHDALLDPRFSNNPLVLQYPNIRFYAGAPLITSEGHIVGTLCVLDQSPGSLKQNEQLILRSLAKQVMQLMDFDESLTILKEQYTNAKRSEIELRSFFESSIEHHLLLGTKFEILAFNKTWERHVKNSYGLQLEKYQSMINYVHQDNLREFYKDYATALKGTAVYDERNLTQNGKENWLLVKFEPAFNAEGEIIGVSINFSDINKRVQHEKKLKLQFEQLDQIALIQSHEIRRPVASILGLMDLIQREGKLNNLEEWMMLQKAVKELDDTIRSMAHSIKPD